jgi:transposase
VSEKTRSSYTKEQKQDAVRLVQVSGQSINRTAKDLGIPENTLWNWVHQAKIDAGESSAGAYTTEEKAELRRLRKELRVVTMERDFLKKAAAYFAKEESERSK